ncbi:hypothetical protein [Burkholderia pseudomallei]|uniref:hypothetical protein n=1 Tax=Burkholderia pseudomallei TaxID=28450 RepID=UPI0011773FF6|nr:hypothetical protein [Burkholderia pseudomallei]MBF3518082.1 hypothetical protein [Burkholderia pseudomallei]MBF4016293.1 hypothetical protein [Burkholderia pseudomallei]
MEYIQIKPTDTGLHVEGFPDAIKLIKIAGPKAERAADLALHKHDLEFAAHCLERLAFTPHEDPLLQRVLWSSAIVHFIKCFAGGGVRSALDANAIYADNHLALESYRYFLELRNKHIIHDVNAYADCTPSAVLNRQDAEHTIAKITFLSRYAVTLEQDSFSNLTLLTKDATQAVEKEFDTLCDEITSELQKIPYSELLVVDSVTLTVPKLSELYGARKPGNASGRTKGKHKKAPRR